MSELDFSTLNDAQREAVLATDGPVLVLAGAGSGKTRVLTYRIAHLLQSKRAYPSQILAVTFTNKAAREMRERLQALLAEQPYSLRSMWVCTFHSMCVRMLHACADRLGFTSSFAIYDADDSKRLIKEVMSELGLSAKTVPEAAVRSRISNAKNDLITADAYEPRAHDPIDKAVARVYRAYQQRLHRANAMDFDDLLLYAYILLRDNDDVRESYANRFRYILVDEYQDTNHAQYEITRLLASAHRNLMVVGDDDQSIYSWRGADVRNILEFESDWPDTLIVKLEQNYRSTANILNAANAVIAHNSARKDKRLFTDGEQGEKISVYLASEERDEGRWIASQIEQLHDTGVSYDDIALFYRTNAQSRILEDMFLRAGVPYRIVGGTRFFDRAEIRDVMAYLKLSVNPADDISALRVINTPKRGIGKTTVAGIREIANVQNLSFVDAVREEALDPATRPKARAALTEFLEIIDSAASYAGALEDVVQMIIEKTGLEVALRAQGTDEALTRVENIREFASVVREFAETHELVQDRDDGPAADDVQAEPTFHEPTLSDFMEWLSLRTDLDAVDGRGEASVTMMTVHAAKGLEYDCVFVAGMEEGIFPHQVSLQEHGVEEERRLAYVAMTRARKRLYLSHAQTRRLFNDLQANARSRFVNEIPAELVEHDGIGSLGMVGTGWEKRGDRRGISGSGRGEEVYGGRIFGSGGHVDARKQAAKQTKSVTEALQLSEGDKVEHKTFGPGRVMSVDGDKVTIHFSRTGKTKNLLLGYAPLVKVEK